MRLARVIFIVLLSYMSYSQNVWFKHLNGFTARQSFSIGDTIYTFGDELTDYGSYERFRLQITQTSFDSSFISSKLLPSDSFVSFPMGSALLRYQRGVTLDNGIYYIGLSVVGSDGKDKGILTKYSPKGYIIDTINCTKDTFDTIIENTLFINNQSLVCGFYIDYPTQFSSKLTTFLRYYKGKKLLWVKQYPDEGGGAIRWVQKNALKNNLNNGTFFIGFQMQWDFSGSPEQWEEFIIKMDTSGKELWRCQPNNRDSINPDGIQMVQKPNGNLLVSWCDYWHRPHKNLIGSQLSQLNRKATVWFAEIDINGKVLWRKNIRQYLSAKLADTTQILLHSKALLLSDGVLWTGNYSYYYDHSYLLKTDYDGNPKWYREYELYPKSITRDEFTPYDITATSDGGFVLTGEFTRDFGNQKATIVKVDGYGCLEPGCQKLDDVINREKMQKIYKVYPNPTTGQLYIEMGVDNAEINLIKIYSTDGKLLEQIPIRGSGKVNLDKFNSGLYFLAIVNEAKETQTHKIIIVR